MQTYLTTENQLFIIREANENDAERLIEFGKIIFAAYDQVLTTLEEYTVTVDQQKLWINSFAEHPSAVILIAEMDGQIIALLDFSTKSKNKIKHSGEFGVSVHPDFKGKGVGRKMIEELLLWAERNNGVEKVFLNVFATNENAISLYRTLGFTEEGRHLRAIKQPSGEYIDLIQMYKLVRQERS